VDPDLFAQRRVGTTLRGKWRLERLLGVGGMAAVYVGVHAIGRRDAIKILHPEVARSRELRARFEQEAHAVNRLKHEGAVEIRDIDATEDGAPFLVMELLDGESLADRAARLDSIDPSEILRLTDELLDVLGAAHAQGIIHRDIKLDNLFVLRDGRLKVLDFGIARVRDGMQSDLHTRTGSALGTVPYMAPEQIRGIDVDARVDLFAVGATMFRLIARRRVHEAETEAIMMIKMATEPAPSLASVAPAAPPGLCLVVDRALQFQRDQRYPDAITMRRDVQALRAGAEPPHAAALARGDGAFHDERTVAVAPRAVALREGPEAVVASPPTSLGQASVPVAAAPLVAARAPTAVRAKSENERKLLIALVAMLSAMLLLVFVVLLVKRAGNASTAGAAPSGDAPATPAGTGPDDPSWRPSPATKQGVKRGKGRGHGHGRGHGGD
jgi:serine/threonine-protein kinase